MKLFRNIQKGVITSLFGILIIGVTAHQYIQSGEVDYTVVLSALMGGGFLFAKDQGASHTK